MAQIPNDIIYSCILPKLPVKSLTRFKCVSKSWQTLISSPDFIRLHRRHALSSDANHLVITDFHSDTHFVAYDLDSPLDEPLFYPYPEFETLVSDAKPIIVASCEFYVLISIESLWERFHKLFVLNPSTHSYHEIPCRYSTNEFPCAAFEICHDETNDNNFKVFLFEHYINNQGEVSIEIMMYTSITDSWREIGLESTPDASVYSGFGGVVVINNLLYVTLWTIYLAPGTNAYIRIGCFNIQAEQWTNVIPLPNDILYGYRLRLLDGSLCVHGNSTENGSFNVWLMKDCWVKLMSIDIDITKEPNHIRYYPIAYQRGSRDELLCRRNNRFFRYNLRDKVATDLASDNDLGDEIKYYIARVCRESLVTFPNKLQKVVPREIYNSLQNNSTQDEE